MAKGYALREDEDGVMVRDIPIVWVCEIRKDAGGPDHVVAISESKARAQAEGEKELARLRYFEEFDWKVAAQGICGNSWIKHVTFEVEHHFERSGWLLVTPMALLGDEYDRKEQEARNG